MGGGGRKKGGKIENNPIDFPPIKALAGKREEGRYVRSMFITGKKGGKRHKTSLFRDRHQVRRKRRGSGVQFSRILAEKGEGGEKEQEVTQ